MNMLEEIARRRRARVDLARQEAAQAGEAAMAEKLERVRSADAADGVALTLDESGGLELGMMSSREDLDRAETRLRQAQDAAPAARHVHAVSAPAPARVLAMIEIDGKPFEVTSDAADTSARIRAAMAAHERRAQDAKEIAETKAFVARLVRALGYRTKNTVARFSDKTRDQLLRSGFTARELNELEWQTADALVAQPADPSAELARMAAQMDVKPEDIKKYGGEPQKEGR